MTDTKGKDAKEMALLSICHRYYDMRAAIPMDFARREMQEKIKGLLDAFNKLDEALLELGKVNCHVPNFDVFRPYYEFLQQMTKYYLYGKEKKEDLLNLAEKLIDKIDESHKNVREELFRRQ